MPPSDRPEPTAPETEQPRPGTARRADDDRSEHEVLEQLARIAAQLSEADDLDELLELIVELGEDYLEGCDGVSIMFVGEDRRIFSPAFSSRIAYESDLAQYEADEGPCLDALRDQRIYQIDDLETETRWPDYRARALQLGVRSMLSYRLFARSRTYGALDFYSERPHVYGAFSRVIGQVFASHAAVALKGAITEAGLERAIESRDTIGQAKGILSERFGITPAESFKLLARISQHQHVRVRDLADHIVTTGSIPGQPG